jgi:hypothetical protein
MILWGAAHYRQKALEMRAQAQHVRSGPLRAAYLALADNWEGMAEGARDEAATPGVIRREEKTVSSA